MNWEKGWAVLASMSGLQSLCVRLVDPSQNNIWEGNWLELENLILEPVKKVRVEAFEVVLPYDGCETERDMGSCRVKLRRPGEVEQGQP